jgi:uncharacterized protein DUF6580
MNAEFSEKGNLLYRTLLALVLIGLAAAVRIAPHPWNFTPVGAMALFSGAVLKDRRLAFAFPLLALFAGDLFVGFYKLSVMLVVYASFLLSVLIGRWVQNHRSLARISGATLLGAIQFFLVTNFAAWQFLGGYPHNASGLLTCYIAGIPLFWNTLGGDALYATLLFGGYALAERFLPALRQSASAMTR